jgi:hypothetical protein
MSPTTKNGCEGASMRVMPIGDREQLLAYMLATIEEDGPTIGDWLSDDAVSGQEVFDRMLSLHPEWGADDRQTWRWFWAMTCSHPPTVADSTPEMQSFVKEIWARFVRPDGEHRSYVRT